MKYLTLIALIFLSCNQKNKDQKNSNTFNDSERTQLAQLEDCEKYWSTKFPSDSIRQNIISTIIDNSDLSEVNLEFLKALKHNGQDKMAIEKALSPIFELPNENIGVFSFPTYQTKDGKTTEATYEKELIKSQLDSSGEKMNDLNKLRSYPSISDSILNDTNSKIYYYSLHASGETRVTELSSFTSECLDYYKYSFDPTDIESKNFLIASPFKIDMNFSNFPEIDNMIQNQVNKECYECPVSLDSMKTFAKLIGTENLYFAYAYNFDGKEQLGTPSRALIWINNNEVVYLWYEEIDLIGCSCI